MTKSEAPCAREIGKRELSDLRRQGGKALGIAITVPLISGMLLIAQALLLSQALGQAIAQGRPVAEVWPQIATFGGLFALRVGLGFIGECAGSRASEQIKRAARESLTARLLTHRPDWIHARSSGALTGAVVDHVEALDGFFSRFLPATIQAGLLPIAFAAAVMPFDWVVGLLFLFTAPMIPLFMALAGWGAQAASDAQADALSRLSGYFGDRLRGLLTLKLFGRMEIEATAMHTATDELRRRTFRVLRIAFLSSAVLEFFAALGVAGVALYVGLNYLDLIGLRAEPLSLQAGLFCLLLAPEVYQPLRSLAAHYHDRAQAKGAIAEIIRQFGEIPASVPAAASPVPGSVDSGPISIQAKGLSLTTPDGRATILAPSDLSIPAGSHVALLGLSGTGKSTLLNAIARLGQADGIIFLGNRRLHDIGEHELRRMLAIVSQRPRLFHGTIADNIRLADPGASAVRVRKAAETALVTAFTDNLPDGLATLVGEGGLGLSGGESQRVALARLYLTDPSVILLDEPTAHLDFRTETAVLDSLIDFAKGRTLVIATHSAAVAARMGSILRFHDRRLVPAGAATPVNSLDPVYAA